VSSKGGTPLDAAVRKLFELSWGKARAYVAGGKVKVDGQVIVDPLFRTTERSNIELVMNAPRASARRLSREAIVHMDPHVVVVDKPSGISTIPYEEGERGALDELVKNALPRTGGAVPSLGVVHRIDKETSGLVVFTRTWLAKQSLSSQFRAHTVHRRYLAIVHGVITSQHTFKSHLIANRGDGLRGSSRKGDGQLAITHVEPLQKLKQATLLACRLETGRTHQIRIHLSEAGHPLVGEKVYIRNFAGEKIDAPRMMLHAAELGFIHPATEREVRFEREPPEDFQRVLSRLSAG
jgi:23S rRNA pseudouridine1911/1915/1917 synthase